MPASLYSLICCNASLDVTFHLCNFYVCTFKFVSTLVLISFESSSHKPGLLGEVVDLEFLFVFLEDSALLHRSQQGLSSLAGHVVQLGVQPSGKLVLEENIEECSIK